MNKKWKIYFRKNLVAHLFKYYIGVFFKIVFSNVMIYRRIQNYQNNGTLSYAHWHALKCFCHTINFERYIETVFFFFLFHKSFNPKKLRKVAHYFVVENLGDLHQWRVPLKIVIKINKRKITKTFNRFENPGTTTIKILKNKAPSIVSVYAIAFEYAFI